MSALPLAVAVGDPAGVGPIVAIEAIARFPGERFLLFGDADALRARAAGALSNATFVDAGAVRTEEVALHAPSIAGGAQQLAALDAAIDAVLDGRARGLVTGPTSKESIVLAGHAFVGQTEHLARRCGLADDDVSMLFLGPKLRVALVTTHLAIVDVPNEITPARVARTVSHLAMALARLGHARPSIAVCGLNPHAGEHGLFGIEERDIIGPAVAATARTLAADVGEPRPAEAIFRDAAAGRVDGVVAMFHDQATIASKLLDWGSAVNVTWGLPFVRTSVDHGVAYDAAARGVADADGMLAAIALAMRLTA